MKKIILVLFLIIIIKSKGITESNFKNSGIEFFEVNKDTKIEDIENFMETIQFSEKYQEHHVLEYKNVSYEGNKFNKIRYEFFNNNLGNDMAYLTSVHLFSDEINTNKDLSEKLDKLKYLGMQGCFFVSNGTIKRWYAKGNTIYTLIVN